MPELGRAALVVTLGLSVYALVAGAAAARLGRRRLAQSAHNALILCFPTTAVAAAAAFPAPAIAQNRRRWRMVTTWPKNLPGLGTGAQYFADQVTRCSGGRLTVQLFASGEIVPAFESIDAVKAGTVEMGHGCPYYWKGKAPAAE